MHNWITLCIPETNTLFINYTPIQNKKIFRKERKFFKSVLFGRAIKKLSQNSLLTAPLSPAHRPWALQTHTVFLRILSHVCVILGFPMISMTEWSEGWCLRDEESDEIHGKRLGADGEGAGQDVDHVKYKETGQGLLDSDVSLGLSISSTGCMDLHLPVVSIQRDNQQPRGNKKQHARHHASCIEL